MNTVIYLLFPIAIIIHNLEEALWMPGWSKYAKKFHKEIKPYEFHFAVLIVTVFAAMITSGIMFNPQNKIVQFFYFGFLGAMIVNAFFPHLLSAIILKRYAPGTITALLLNVPINSIIIYNAICYEVVSFKGVIISTIAVGGLILLSLPLLYKLSIIVKDYIDK